MPGTPVQPTPEEDHLAFAHRKAVEIASKTSDPVMNPIVFNRIYWVVMGGYGFRPYIIGGY